LYLARWLDTS